MAEKRPNTDNGESVVPRKRKAISLAQKKQIINLYEGGYGPSFIARDLNFSISTISSILKDKDRIKEHLKGTVSLDSAMITKRRSLAICEMEKILMAWIEKESQLGKPQTQSSIQNKAYSIYDEIYKKFGDENKIFTASPGWFRRFKVRNKCNIAEDMCNLKSGKPVDLVERFWKKISKNDAYDSTRIFKLIEFDFYWHKLPNDTVYNKNDEKHTIGCKNDNPESTSLLLCGNLAGNYKLKPMMILPNEKSELAEDSDNLPVSFRVQENIKMNKKLFEDWFSNCFVREVDKYCQERKIPTDVMLIINESDWFDNIEDLTFVDKYPQIKIKILPRENIQDQRSFDKFLSLYFKGYYLQSVFVQAIEEFESDESFNFIDFWENYDVLQCFNNLLEVWDDLSMNYLCAICTYDIVQMFLLSEAEKSEKVGDTVDEIIKLASELNITMNKKNVLNFIDGVVENKKKIIVVLNGVNKIVDVTKVSDSQNIPPNSGGFNSKELTTAFYEISSALRRLHRMDCDQERFQKAKTKIQEALFCYRQMLVFKNDQKK